MRLDGGCHCGFIKYEAEVEADSVSVCHCTDCQTLSGSAFRTAVFARKDGFRIVAGEPRIYVKTAESGNQRAQAFCPQCGTHIYAAAVSDPQVFGIRTGTARQRADLRPKRQIWCRSSQPWAMDLKSISQLPGQTAA